MPVDLSKLSDDDLVALKSGDLTKVSNQGLLTLKGASMQSPAERVANDPITKGAQDVLSADPADLAMANPAVRAGLGAISPVLGLIQFGAEGLNSQGFSEYLKRLDEMKQRATTALDGSTSGDIANAVGTGSEIAGNVLSFAPAGKITPAASVLGRLGQGAAIGGVAGLTSPVVSGEDYWGSKGGQTLLGITLGAAIPAGIEAGKLIGGGVKNVFDLFTPEGAKRILTKYQRQIIGEQNIPDVVKALQGAQENIPGYPTTAAEALVGTPAGSPIAAHQRITATTPGGVSAQFGQRKLDQIAAMEAFRDRTAAEAEPLREAALNAANKGGVNVGGIQDTIDNILKLPGKRASTVVQKALGSISEKLNSLADDAGKIDARDLYTVRKEIGSTIESFSKETSNWDKKLSAGLERDIQGSIDTAIEKAGGTGWKDYLNKYATGMQRLDNEIARRKEALTPPQRTNLAGGQDVAGQMTIHGPQMLSRPMMVTNYILKKMGEGVEKRIDPEAANRYLDPQALAKALSNVTLADRQGVIAELVKRGRLPAIGAASEQAVQTQ